MHVSAHIVDEISIHALRKESDLASASSQFVLAISIHALRKESDMRNDMECRSRPDFNPRSP